MVWLEVGARLGWTTIDGDDDGIWTTCSDCEVKKPLALEFGRRLAIPT